MTKVINFVVFQLGWFACVYGGANQLPWLGTLFVMAIAVLHLSVVKRPAMELRLMLSALLIGLVWELFMVNAGLITYPSGILIDGTPPHWILALWVLFAMTLNLSMRWLKQYFYRAMLLGALVGPLSYLAGARLGGATFADTTLAMVTLAAGWAVITPLLLALAGRYDGMPEQSGKEFTSKYLEEAREHV